MTVGSNLGARYTSWEKTNSQSNCSINYWRLQSTTLNSHPSKNFCRVNQTVAQVSKTTKKMSLRAKMAALQSSRSREAGRGVSTHAHSKSRRVALWKTLMLLAMREKLGRDAQLALGCSWRVLGRNLRQYMVKIKESRSEGEGGWFLTTGGLNLCKDRICRREQDIF